MAELDTSDRQSPPPQPPLPKGGSYEVSLLTLGALAHFRAALAAFDDDALAALANKGLVRRARKDLETSQPANLDADGERLQMEVGDGVVRLALPPAQSTCNCPAGGICRHILSALIFVRESAPAEATDAPPSEPTQATGDDILAITDEELTKWAGKPLAAKASKALALGLTAEFELASALIIRFPSRNVQCRWMPGAGLAGMVCSCHATGACEHKVAAVLAFQASRGARDLAGSESLMREESTDAPRTREEILASVGHVLTSLVATGSSRLSRATAERLRTLAVSAHGVDLPRLERSLNTLADEVELSLARNAQSDSARLLSVAARLEALRHALQVRPTHALVGEHRTSYEAVGELTLIGLGARRWRARSGFAGLTLYFWDVSARSWSTWTDARPTTVSDFDPQIRYDGEGPWSGIDSPSFASRQSIRLSNAWRNRNGRFSGRPSTLGFATGPSDPSQAPLLDRWSDLVSRAVRLFGGGLGDRDEREAIVLIAPKVWLPGQFDEVRQELVRLVVDGEGRMLPLVLPNTPETEGAIRLLETLDPAQAQTVLGQLRLEAGRLVVEPIAVHAGTKTLNLTLDSDKAQTAIRPASGSVFPSAPEESEEVDEEFDAGDSSTALGQLLGQLALRLEGIGAGGLAAFRRIDELQALAKRADAVGLSVCARSAARVAERLASQRRGEEIDEDQTAQEVLRAYYNVRLASAHESISAATFGLSAPALEKNL